MGLYDNFVVKPAEKILEYGTGYKRGDSTSKIKYHLIRKGPMFKRWAIHLTKGAVHYGDNNWTLAETQEELERFLESAQRHFEQWLDGETDEDHASALFFNVNGAEYTKERLDAQNNLPILRT